MLRQQLQMMVLRCQIRVCIAQRSASTYSSCTPLVSTLPATGRFDTSRLPPRLQVEFDAERSTVLLQHLTGTTSRKPNGVAASAKPLGDGDAGDTAAVLHIPPSARWVVGWKCQACGNPWTSRVADRTDNRRILECPSCPHNSPRVVDACPQLVAEWDVLRNASPEYNIVEDVDTIRVDSPTRVWWSCQECHRPWREAVFARIARLKRTNAVSARSSTASGQKAAAGPSGCPRCDELRLSAKQRAQRTTLAEHPYLMSEAVLAQGECPTTLKLADQNTLQWQCCYCQHVFRASLADRSLRAKHCPNCCKSGANPINSVRLQRPDVMREVAVQRRVRAFDVGSMSTLDAQSVVFVCRTCITPFTMSMKERCAFPPGAHACPKCRYARNTALAEHRRAGAAAHTYAIPSRRKRRSRDTMVLAEHKLRAADASLLN